MFDLDQFKQRTVTGELDTKIIPLDAGEYPAQVKEIDFDQTKPKDSSKAARVILRVKWDIDSVEQKQATGRDNLTVTQDIFLDLTEQGTLDMGRGKNIGLGRLRAALGQNDPTQPWGFDNLVGGVARVKVSQDPDKNDPEVIYNRINAVSAL